MPDSEIATFIAKVRGLAKFKVRGQQASETAKFRAGRLRDIVRSETARFGDICFSITDLVPTIVLGAAAFRAQSRNCPLLERGPCRNQPSHREVLLESNRPLPNLALQK
jgi:hypothetical protein